jgi:hypothetical protein
MYMARLAMRCAGAAVLAVLLLSSGAADARKPAARCLHHGDRLLALNARFVLRGYGSFDSIDVCRRSTGSVHHLVYGQFDLHDGTLTTDVVALGPHYAYGVLRDVRHLQESSKLVSVSLRSWRSRSVDLRLGDQGDQHRTQVRDIVPARRGMAVVRVRNTFAAGIVVVGPRGAVFLDEGLATSIGRPRVRGGRAIWRHGPATRSSPTTLTDRCPRPPTPVLPQSWHLTGMFSLEIQRLETGDAVSSGDWYCLRASGAAGRADGPIVRLLGTLAVVQRTGDARVVDLRTGTTVSGPIENNAEYGDATLGPSGTLVLAAELGGVSGVVAAVPGAPPRVFAGAWHARYEDGLLRYELVDRLPSETFTARIP